MRIIKAKDYNDMSKKAAYMIAAQIILKPESVLGLATGSSPIGTYDNLVNMCKSGDVDFNKVKVVNLDEYKGLKSEDSQSYYYFMKEKLFSHININLDNTYIPNGIAEDEEAECERYNMIIESLGGVDFQLLGIGHNGHIGFNEPNDVFAKDTHVVALAQSTIDANSRLFDNIDDVPRFAYTMGIRSIFKAKKILMIVNGEEKSQIVKDAFFGPITPQVPASILQMHNDVTIIADEAALSKL